MAKILESVQTVNSLVRTVLAMVVVGAAGMTGWWGYRTHNASELAIREREEQLDGMRQQLDTLNEDLSMKTAEIAQQSRRIVGLQDDLREREAEIERLDAAISLLTVDHRLARLTVLEQTRDADALTLRTRVQFVELDGSGRALGRPREFELQGDVVFIDAWVVKFDDRYIQNADLKRGTSLVLFRRLFGEHLTPEDGFILDEVGVRPQAYALGREASEFEKRIWSEFWSLANNPAEAQELGIRAAHGEAPSIRVKSDMSYLLLLRSSDGLSITVDPEAMPSSS